MKKTKCNCKKPETIYSPIDELKTWGEESLIEEIMKNRKEIKRLKTNLVKAKEDRDYYKELYEYNNEEM